MSSRGSSRSLRPLLTLCLLASLAVAPSVARAGTLPTLTVAVTKTSITLTGAKESGAVNVVLTASGVKEAGAILFLMTPGVTDAEIESFFAAKGAAGDPNNTIKYGSIVFDAEVGEGKDKRSSDRPAGRQLPRAGARGRQRPQGPHLLHRHRRRHPGRLCRRHQATVRSIEFGFRGPRALHNGELVRFENEGFLVHMDIATSRSRT